MKKVIALLALLASLVIPSIVHAQLQSDWVRRYDGPVSGSETAASVLTDTAGNVYSLGSSATSSGTMIVLIKHDSLGNQLWLATNSPASAASYPAEGGHPFALDNMGNIVAVGRSIGPTGNYDYLTIKFSPDGTELWEQRYNGDGNGVDVPAGVAIDFSGNVYVTGYSTGPSGTRDYITVKYDPSGNQQWVRRFIQSGPFSFDERATAIAVDSQSNVYVTGDAYGDYTTIKYSSEGLLMWERRYNHFDGGDYPIAIAVDSQDNIIVIGRSNAIIDYPGTYPYPFNRDFATVKYSTDGTQLWVARYNGPANYNDVPVALAVTPEDSVIVTGWSQNTWYGDLPESNAAITTIRYDTNGNESWIQRYQQSNLGLPQALAVRNDMIYLSGWMYGLSGTSGKDILTLGYDSQGNLTDELFYNGTGNAFDTAFGVTVTSSGAVFVVGTSAGQGSDWDLVTIRYSPPPPTTQTFSSIGDTYLREGQPNKNWGTETILRVRQNGQNRSLVQFDQNALSTFVGNRTVTSAKLRVYITSNSDNWGASGRDVAVHRLTQVWTELGATWNCPDDTNTANSTPDGLQWEMNNASLWPFVASPSSTVLHTNGLVGWIEFDVTTDVQAFINGSATNYGWIIKKVLEGQSGAVEYSSKDGLFPPELVVTAG